MEKQAGQNESSEGYTSVTSLLSKQEKEQVMSNENENPVDLLLRSITVQSAILTEISRSLAVIAGSMAIAPDIRVPIETYVGFDWESIGAKVLRNDKDGASVVEWNGKHFKRRAPDNKFEPCIWFSRCSGKDEAGNNKYDVLISFEQIKDDVDPIGEKARKLIGQAGAQRAQAPNPPPVSAPPPPPPPPPVKQPAASEEDLDKLAQRIVANDAVDKDGSAYRVMVDPRTVHTVSRPGQRLVCTCDRHKANPETRCEHIRAVSLWYQNQKSKASA